MDAPALHADVGGPPGRIACPQRHRGHHPGCERRGGVSTTIQRGITLASAGDTVVVNEGTYREASNFPGKEVVLTSTNGAAATIFDASGFAAPTVGIRVGLRDRSSPWV